jgi:hypothetical protein
LVRISEAGASKFYPKGLNDDLKDFFSLMVRLMEKDEITHVDQESQLIRHYFAIIQPMINAGKSELLEMLRGDAKTRGFYSKTVELGLKFNPDNPAWLMLSNGENGHGADAEDDYGYGDEDDYGYGDDGEAGAQQELTLVAQVSAKAPEDSSWIVRRAAVNFISQNLNQRDGLMGPALVKAMPTLLALVTSNDSKIKEELLKLLSEVVPFLGYLKDSSFDRADALGKISNSIYQSWSLGVYNIDAPSLDPINTIITKFTDVANKSKEFYPELYKNLKGILQKKDDSAKKGPCYATLRSILKNLDNSLWKGHWVEIFEMAFADLESLPKESSALLKSMLNIHADDKNSLRFDKKHLARLVEGVTGFIDSSAKDSNEKYGYLEIYGAILMSLRSELDKKQTLVMLKCIRGTLDDEVLMESALEALQGFKMNLMKNTNLDSNGLKELGLIFDTLVRLFQDRSPAIKFQMLNVFYGFHLLPDFSRTPKESNVLFQKMKSDISS